MNRRARASGSAWDVAFSKDREQRLLFVPDGINNRINILNRQSLEVLTAFGDGGRQPGHWFVNKGLGPVAKLHQVIRVSLARLR